MLNEAKFPRYLAGATGLLCAVFLFPVAGAAQQQPQQYGPERAIMVREAQLYLTPDPTSQKIGVVGRGREVAFVEPVNGEWAHVLANVDNGANSIRQEEYTEPRDVAGWIRNSGIIRTSTPAGAEILFGEAADSEAQAEKRGGRRGAASDALRLYERIAEYFPTSPYAGESLWRAADIRWQLERDENRSRPSSRLNESAQRPEMESADELHKVEKKFPHTKWSDLAAYDLLDNKLCGDWLGQSKCPQKESDMYENYVKDHPDSPKVAEALYEAAWRRAALIDIYKGERDDKKSEEARASVLSLAQRIIQQAPQSDWAARASMLAYKAQNNISTYGTSIQ